MPNRPPSCIGRCSGVALILLALSACGGGGGGEPSPTPPSPPPVSPPVSPPTGTLPPPASRVSADTPVAAACTGGATAGQFFANTEVEPFAATQSGHPNLIVSTWQQDRWSNGGARAVVTAVSRDTGLSWTRQLMPFSRCGGAGPGSAGDFERASDPWVDIGPSGILYSMALGFNLGALLPGSSSAMLVSRSTDGGLSWSPPTTLRRDGDKVFNDKNTLTADPTDARYVYAVWDRLDDNNFGPTWMARSQDSGATWEAARQIYAPTVAPGSSGVSQTIGNRIVVLPDGTLVNLFTQIDTVGNQASTWLGVLRSADKGLSWSAPIRVSALQSIGTQDPQTRKAVRDGSTLGAIALGTNGSLWLTWQDARFSGGQRDAIALSRSNDGGLSWSAPVAINSRSDVAAFTPSVAVTADGLIGISHYDLRADTAAADTLLAGAWLLTSRDGLNWVESPVWNPFDLAQAPDARGLFLGDYQGLIGAGAGFLPVLALSGSNTGNRTDVYALRVTPASGASSASAASILARPVPTARAASNDEANWRQARHQAIVNAMERRLPGWTLRARLTAGPAAAP